MIAVHPAALMVMSEVKRKVMHPLLATTVPGEFVPV
jgi:hypothetical protein